MRNFLENSCVTLIIGGDIEEDWEGEVCGSKIIFCVLSSSLNGYSELDNFNSSILIAFFTFITTRKFLENSSNNECYYFYFLFYFINYYFIVLISKLF